MATQINLAQLAKFYTDPDWKIVEDLLLGYINEECDKLPPDSTAPTDYKAQIIVKKRVKNALLKFLSEVKIVNQKIDNPSWN